eukprot:277087-Pyramimonas_sp.AAC.1
MAKKLLRPARGGRAPVQGSQARLARGPVHGHDARPGHRAYFSRPPPLLEGAPRHRGHPRGRVRLGEGLASHRGALRLVGYLERAPTQHSAFDLPLHRGGWRLAHQDLAR